MDTLVLCPLWINVLAAPGAPITRNSAVKARVGITEHWEVGLVPGPELTSHELAEDGSATHADTADRGPTEFVAPASNEMPAGEQPSRARSRRLLGLAGLWLSVFTFSLGLFIVRFLVP